RRRYPAVLQTDLVLQLLLADESNPRSVAFQLASLLHQIHRLQEKEQDAEHSPERELSLRALNSIRSSSMEEVSRRDPTGNFSGLEELVRQVKATLWELSETLTERYFANLIACPFSLL